MAEAEATVAAGRRDRRRRLPFGGRLLALAAAAALGGTTPFARLAYDAGTSPLTLLVVRFALAVLVFSAFLGLTGKPLWPRKRDLPAFLLASLALTGLTLGYLLSIAFIPVGLAALLLYSFPLMVAALAPFIEGTKLRPAQLLAFLAAFIGLACALGPEMAVLDPRGILLALSAALSMALLLFLVRYLSGSYPPVTILFQGNLVGLLLVGGLLLLLEPPLIANTFFGLAMLGIAAALYIVGMGLSFLAVHAIGPTQTALTLNLEPLMAIALAMLLLKERLGPLQLAGGLLVLIAIYWASRPACAEKAVNINIQ